MSVSGSHARGYLNPFNARTMAGRCASCTHTAEEYNSHHQVVLFFWHLRIVAHKNIPSAAYTARLSCRRHQKMHPLSGHRLVQLQIFRGGIASVFFHTLPSPSFLSSPSSFCSSLSSFLECSPDTAWFYLAAETAKSERLYVCMS